MISINGKSYQSGNNITITNGRVVIDGVDQTPDGKEVNIVVHGDVNHLEVDCAQKVSVIGQCQTVSSVSGDIDIAGDVGGSVKSVSGDIECGEVAGSVKTVSGDITHGLK